MKHRESPTERRLREEKIREARELCERGYIWAEKLGVFVPIDVMERAAKERMGVVPKEAVSFHEVLARSIRPSYK